MLKGKLAESNEQLWEPVESGQVIRALLRWIYLASLEEEVGKSIELLENLFSAAHKYDLEPLSRECHRRMITLLEEGNAFQLLCFSDFYELEPLKVRALKLIVSKKIPVDPNSVSQWENARSLEQKFKLAGELYNEALKIGK